MRSASDWFAEYGDSHRHPTNELLHWICVPVIVLCVLGFLWSLPTPAAFAGISTWLNWATLTIAGGLAYYAALSLRLALAMVPVMVVMVWLLARLDALSWPLWAICAVAFALAWIGQFVGHAIEGRRPSFVKDLQFLLIGPLWLLGTVFRRFGLRY
jgi:uncharacterized membrane protein YGL010W